jgi:hypothetical protein
LVGLKKLVMVKAAPPGRQNANEIDSGIPMSPTTRTALAWRLMATNWLPAPAVA